MVWGGWMEGELAWRGERGGMEGRSMNERSMRGDQA